LNAEYTLPKFLSEDAKDLVSKIFITDPEKRINVNEIREHPWFKLY
jgi:serine/threonine protein kinase